MSIAVPAQLPDQATLRQLPTEQLVNLIVQQQQGTLAAATGNRAIDAHWLTVSKSGWV